jgi:hypothetical protein
MLRGFGRSRGLKGPQTLLEGLFEKERAVLGAGPLIFYDFSGSRLYNSSKRLGTEDAGVERRRSLGKLVIQKPFYFHAPQRIPKGSRGGKPKSGTPLY